MTDLVERLRAVKSSQLDTTWGGMRMLDDIHAAAARIEALQAEVARLQKPEWFYSVEDPEYRSGGDVQDVVDDMDHEGVMEVAGAREVWKKWVAVRCVTVDEAGDVDETEAATFDTPEEAERCWPESLAKARAALASGETG